MSILFIVFLIVFIIKAYNSFTTEEEKVKSAWSQVEIQYQRRADIISNIIATVKGYAIHENDLLDKLTETRTKASQIVIDPSKCTQQQLNDFQTIQKEMGQHLHRILVVAENYPDLKASMNFRDLQTQLERTENDIAIARNTYTQLVCSYNVKICRFPANIIASFMGFKKKVYFEVSESIRNSPNISF